MKKIILLLVLFLCPFTVYALTDQEANAILDDISVTQENSTYIINMNSIDPDILIGSKCEFTREQIIAEDPEVYGNYDQEQIQALIAQNTAGCRNRVLTGILDFYLKSIDIDPRSINIGYDFTDKNHVEITIYNYFDGRENPQRSYKLNYVTLATNLTDTATSIINSLNREYVIYGMAVLNTVYHYGAIDSVIYDNDFVLYRFPEFKQNLEKHPEYTYGLDIQGLGGTPTITGSEFWLGMFKNNILVGIKSTGFSMNHVLYVDEALEGSVYEKAEKRIKEYFNDKITVSVSETPDFILADDPNLDEEINEYLDSNNGTYVGYFTTLTLGNKEQHILIVEIPKSKLDIVEIKAKDYTTGVNINTQSPEVPLDATIDVQDVSNAEYVVKASKDNNIKLVKVYDINLKKTSSNTLVNEIPEGVEVFIPITGKKVGDKVNVYYIKSDATVGQTIEATVVKVQDELYAMFTTNHFSTYALGDIKNPNTGDNITLFIVGIGISIIGLVKITFDKKKNI